MKVLTYSDLKVDKFHDKIKKIISYLRAGNFRAADVKKMTDSKYYRAKLDDTNRLLFCIADVNGKKFILILELILNHAYEKSRFLNGATIDESKLLPVLMEEEIKEEDTIEIGYINPQHSHFHILDKIMSFDNIQDEILGLQAPSIIIGSAGSGKTVIALEKAKTLEGRVLFITLSAYLAENASLLYHAKDYQNEEQEVVFLSFLEYLSTFDVPKGKEIDFRSFEEWISRYRQSHKIKDAYKIFEEFKGVLTGSMVDKAYLSLPEYLSLGIRQSIFPLSEREQVYELFTNYLEWLKSGEYFDSNLLSYALQERIKPYYDYVIVDEVQDMTIVQLMVILNSLTDPTHFILCGDSNQIVHPNFFSWTQIKALFYDQKISTNIIRVLSTNYRNTPEVTKIANQLLLIKNARFGSIDKESTYLVKPNSTHSGEVAFFENNHKLRTDLNQKTRQSTKFAVLVLRNEDKAAAKAFFKTPLLFSIQEAKGLEYENIILFNVISSYENEFRQLANGVSPEDLQVDSIKFSRAKNKADRSLDEFKFYVNSLYVAITRAVNNLYIMESNKKHELLSLLGLTESKKKSSVKQQASSKEEWQQEARRLEKQGKQEQADAIRSQILAIQPVSWDVITRNELEDLTEQALNPDSFNKKAKDSLFEYALYYGEEHYFDQLAELKYRPAERWEEDGKVLMKRMSLDYEQDNLNELLPLLQKYGIDFRNKLNISPIMLAISHGAEKILDYLVQKKANIKVVDNVGRTPLQLAIYKAYLDDDCKEKIMNPFYNYLKGESIKVRINNRLIKIDHHETEFLLLNFMISVLQTHLTNRLERPQFFKTRKALSIPFQSIDFVHFFKGLSEAIVPDDCRKRPYLTSILAKHEVNGKGKENKKLFVRLQTGMYLPNPIMEVSIEEEWVNLYDLVDIDAIEKRHDHPGGGFIEQIKLYREQLTTNPDQKINRLSSGIVF